MNNLANNYCCKDNFFVLDMAVVPDSNYYFGFAVQISPNDSLPLLEPHEEKLLRKYYEKRLLDFCSAFKPSMPKSVMVRI